MENTKEKILKVLEFVKANPRTNTNPDELDGNLVESIIERGYLEGIDTTSISDLEPQFIELRLTLSGEEYIESCSIKIAQKSTPTWYSNPFLVAFLALVVAIGSAGVVYYLGWK